MNALFRILVLPVLFILALLGLLGYLFVLAIESLRWTPRNAIAVPSARVEDFTEGTHALRGGR